MAELQKKTIGQATILYREEISTEAQVLANSVKRCYAQKAPWKNYNGANIDTLTELLEDGKQVDEQVFRNHDYVEWIVVDDANKTVQWGQGDFIVGCSFADVLVEPAQIHYASDTVDAVWIGVKPGGMLIYECLELCVWVVNPDGFVGEMACKEKNENCESWGSKNTAKQLVGIMTGDGLDCALKMSKED